MKSPVPVLLSLAVVLLPALVQAHHAFRTVFDFNKTETIEGKVTNLEFINPHIRIHIDVANESGEVEQWLIVGPGRLSLARRGWADDMFAAGESITAIGNPARAGGDVIWLEKIIMPDGTELIDPLISDVLAIEAERRERARQATQD